MCENLLTLSTVWRILRIEQRVLQPAPNQNTLFAGRTVEFIPYAVLSTFYYTKMCVVCIFKHL